MALDIRACLSASCRALLHSPPCIEADGLFHELWKSDKPWHTRGRRAISSQGQSDSSDVEEATEELFR